MKESQDSTIDLPEDRPTTIKLLMQYLYEGEYDPLLPDPDSLGTVGKAVAKSPRPATDPNNRQAYSYKFPHTCCYQGSSCNSPFICPHHRCEYTGYSDNGCCGYSCKGFNCDICNPSKPPVPSLNGKSNQLLTHAEMYEIADKYDVVGLKDLVKEKFDRSCQHFWDKPKFAAAALHAFSTTPDYDKGIREIVSATISAHMELMKKSEVKSLMNDFNGLALGILEEKIKEHGWGKKK